MATPADLAQTVKEVEALDRRIVADQADVRDFGALKAAVDDGVAELGPARHRLRERRYRRLGSRPRTADEAWQDIIDVNLTGVWHTVKAAIPHLIERAGGGGSMILTSSTAGLKGIAAHRRRTTAPAKHGVVGLMRTLALELAPHSIRVNSVHPTVVNTPMIQNDVTAGLFRPDLTTRRSTTRMTRSALNALPIRGWSPSTSATPSLFLASDEARYITGVTLPVDAGFGAK